MKNQSNIIMQDYPDLTYYNIDIGYIDHAPLPE